MLHVRPVVPNDVLLWAEVEPDRWRLGGNRRSFVAELDGQLVGHCRGIDNACHPGSRTLVLEVRPEWRNRGVGTALLKAQVEASTLPLRAKITGAMPEAWALARTFGAVVEQACPPWRRVVEPPLRAWADQHRDDAGDVAIEAVSDDDLAELAQLHASHYVAQHADWSPAASVETIAALFAEDFTPDGDLDIAATRLAREAGAIVAAAVVWKAEAADGTTSQCPGSTIRQPGWRWWPSRCRADLHRHRCHQTSSPTRRRGCDPADRRPLGDGARQPRVRGHAKMER